MKRLIDFDKLEKLIEDYIKITPLEKGERDELRSTLTESELGPGNLLAEFDFSTGEVGRKITNLNRMISTIAKLQEEEKEFTVLILGGKT